MTVTKMKTTFVVETSQTAASVKSFRTSFKILTWGENASKLGFFYIVLCDSIWPPSLLRQGNAHHLRPHYKRLQNPLYVWSVRP